MSLIVTATTSEGIVLAGDSRQSYMNRRGMIRIGSDSIFKVFKLNKRIGIGMTGLAFLPENNVNKSIGKYIEEFVNTYDVRDMGVYDLAKELHTWFAEKYGVEKKMEAFKSRIEVDLKLQGKTIIEIEALEDKIHAKYIDHTGKEAQKNIPFPRELNFIVAGFNQDNSYEVHSLHIPGNISKKKDSNDSGLEYGVDWEGQGDVICRILKGYDSRISNISFVQDAVKKNGELNTIKQLGNLQYSIQWGAMPLQDAVDFCKLMIETTSAIQRFSDGIVAAPGEVPGVGGEVDIAIIRPDTGFQWLKRKELRF